MSFRLLSDENTSHRLVSACQRLVPQFPIIHIADWEGGIWLGLDDAALLIPVPKPGRCTASFLGSLGSLDFERIVHNARIGKGQQVL